ncbi:MAG: sigma-54-dependent Fis family transcriptional regulator, partial [Gemmatimonadetes bacterium]|nr:sigma-54-dependent Fis family transcriptional regulator [Gemmatimonadota bacterium]NIT68450.1 sigma-54-dependent Fis family transcriptional regulator [Gemmatimonadota bacterium]NIV25011.1 sigma-54-dependent Fis family transcriptional regulator [Gemmatimonadota bacterium]NIW77003.1 sigma-54-dependent Fis family transcriptional regulator [Gemmatimonadota bacterium]NIY37027.1 sigma-54-dependent Fis family transcriptional regulator [Gemmatimonadota bacterium]
EIQPEDLALRSRADGAHRLEEMTLEDAERYLIKRALSRHDGNVSQAADSLGLSRSALYRRLQRYELQPNG